MAFDGGFTRKIADELREAEQCHIDKIYQPSHDELVFLLRRKGFAARLLICARPGAARLHFTEAKPENPAVAPMLCMLARKYFSGARFTGVRQNGLERVVELLFETTNELGDRVTPRVICELIGNQANIILVNGEGRIIDAVRRSDLETAQRMVQPGAVYEYPAAQGKANPLETDISVLCAEILKKTEYPLSKAILSATDGISPLIAREISYRAYSDDPITGDVADALPLRTALTDVISDLRQEKKPVLVCRTDGTPADFSYTPITQYGSTMQMSVCESFGVLLDLYYAKREAAARIRHAASDILRTVNNAHSRAQRRLSARLEELKKCEGREQLRIYGELLKANLYAIQPGSHFAEVQNYYDENLETIRIPLNPAVPPSANAAKYFKDYKKSYTAEQTLTALTGEDADEINYLDTVLDSISHCETAADLGEIREELCDAGYIRQKSGNPRRRKEPSGFKEYTSAEGYRILVGKNNRQNDMITTRLAEKNDLWFHVKNIPGSHVVIFCSGASVEEETLLAAAQLAAFYSKASSSAQVPVDYTPVKYVKKPNGAKPGMVIYTTNKTLYVTPQEAPL